MDGWCRVDVRGRNSIRRSMQVLAGAMALLFVAGCGMGLAGEYVAEVRLIEGEQESDSPGYTLAAVQERLAKEPRSLTLQRNGRYVLRSGDSTNEGTWRVEGDTLVLHDDTSNGVAIQPALQIDREWPIRENGEIVRTGSYSVYNLEEVYVRR